MYYVNELPAPAFPTTSGLLFNADGLISLYLLSEEGRCGVQRWEPEDLKFSETLLFLIRCSKLGQNFAKQCHLHALFL